MTSMAAGCSLSARFPEYVVACARKALRMIHTRGRAPGTLTYASSWMP
jgi:hypothetical protein